MSQASPLECVALTTVRRTTDLSRQDLADGAGITLKKMAEHENSLVPPPDLVDAMLLVMNRERDVYEGILSVLDRSRRGSAPPAATPVDPNPDEWREMQARAVAVGREAERRALERQVEAWRVRQAARARAAAETVCARLENDPNPWLAVEKVREVQTWAVAERLAHRSAEIAPEDVERAMEWAALAYRAADLAPCAGEFRLRLLGYTMTFGENALRAAGDLAGAEELYARAEEFWRAGATASGPLEEWRLADLAGSLHRDQERFAESLAQLDASLEKAPAREKGRLLVTKALTVERMGETEKAVGLLAEAEQAVDRQSDPRLFFIVLFNRASFLCRLGRFADAELLLRELTALLEPLGRGLYQTRLRWLRGSIAAGLGRWEDAEADLQAARRELSHRDKVLDCALASLELMVLLCRRERSREIQKLSHAIAGLARNEKLSRAARAALHLVADAAEGSGVTLGLAEQAFQLLQRAPKADVRTTERQDERSAGAPSLALADGRCDGAMATAVRVDDAASIPEPGALRGRQEARPDLGEPGGQPVHETGSLRGAGPAGRQGGSGRGEENHEAHGERTPGDDASHHEKAPSGSGSRRSLPWPRRSLHPENTGAENPGTPGPEIPPEDFCVLVRLLMGLANLTQEQLATVTGLSSNTIGNYRSGKSTPPRIRPVAERLARGARISLFIVDFYLLPAIATEREAGDGTLDDVVESLFRRLRMELQGLVHSLLPGPETDEAGSGRGWPPAEVARQEALDLWQRLESCSEAERSSLVEGWRELQHPGLVELLCHQSAEAASDRTDRALELARLAHRIAELTPGEDAEKRCLEGYAGIFLANALRVAGNLLPARERFEEALASWKAGSGSSTFLEEWRVLDLEASLLRDERQFDLALLRLAKALDVAPSEFTGRLLLSKSAVHEQMGDGTKAVEDLRKAERIVDRESQPRLLFGVRFNLATVLCLLDQAEEAETMYPEIQELASGLQRELDNIRLKWLAGRIAAGRGRLDEADEALDEVREEFTRLRSAWDCSLVTLELATVRLRQGRNAEVRPLAAALVWIFEAQGIHQEALAALALFRDAAEHELATADFTDRLARYLRTAQGDPGLRFGV